MRRILEHRSALAALAACATLTVTALPARSCEPPVALSEPGTAGPQKWHGAPGAAGMVVARDPETGRLGLPSAEQRRDLYGVDPALLRSSEGLRLVRFADGSEMVFLEGRFQCYSIARLGASGRLVFDCVHDPRLVHAPVAGGSSARAEK